MRYAVVIIPAAYLFSRTALGADGVFIAFPVSETLTAAVSYLIYVKSMKKLKL